VLDWLQSKLPVPVPLLLLEDSGKIYFLLSAITGVNMASAAKTVGADECLVAGAD
jgi:aminoglycoside phosphotransferase